MLGKTVCFSAGAFEQAEGFLFRLATTLARFSFKQPLSQLADLPLRASAPTQVIPPPLPGHLPGLLPGCLQPFYHYSPQGSVKFLDLRASLVASW